MTYGGQVYYGNGGNTPDTVNNVEQVNSLVRPSSAQGKLDLKVQVSATSMFADQQIQPYALITTGFLSAGTCADAVIPGHVPTVAPAGGVGINGTFLGLKIFIWILIAIGVFVLACCGCWCYCAAFWFRTVYFKSSTKVLIVQDPSLDEKLIGGRSGGGGEVIVLEKDTELEQQNAVGDERIIEKKSLEIVQ